MNADKTKLRKLEIENADLKGRIWKYKQLLEEIYDRLEPLFHDPNDCIDAAEPVPGHDDRSAD